jgi:hypothetical protein
MDTHFAYRENWPGPQVRTSHGQDCPARAIAGRPWQRANFGDKNLKPRLGRQVLSCTAERLAAYNCVAATPAD